MNRQTTARPAPQAISIIRRPLRLRSRSGPSQGATTAKGAMVNSRYNATRLRAAPGEMEKNSEPARAMVTSVSPAMASTWAVASRPNGVVDSRGRGRDRGPGDRRRGSQPPSASPRCSLMARS